MFGNQQNLTLVENLPEVYFEQLIAWYEDQINQVNVHHSAFTILAEKIEHLKQLSRDNVEKIDESSVRTVSKVVKYPLYSPNDQTFNIAALVLRVALSDEPYNQLDLNLGYNINNDISYFMATHELETMFDRAFEVRKEKECDAVFSNYSNITHFCIRSSYESDDMVLGRAILNGPQMYGFILDEKKIVTEDGEYELMMAINIAKFVSFTQAVESGQDMDTLAVQIQAMTQSLVQDIVKRLMFM